MTAYRIAQTHIRLGVLAALFLWGCATPKLAVEDTPPPPPPEEPANAAPALDIVHPEVVSIEPLPLLPAEPPPAPDPEPEYLTHTVRGPGETLIRMARWYTGNGRNWVALARANPRIDPQRIQIGDVIRIPEAIVSTRRPMPKVVPGKRKTIRKQKRPTAEATLPPTVHAVETAQKAPASPPPADVPLFGPIEPHSTTDTAPVTASAPGVSAQLFGPIETPTQKKPPPGGRPAPAIEKRD